MNLARCRVYVGEKIVAPRTPSNYIAGNAGPIHIQYLNEPVWDEVPVLNWDVWNVDTLFAHTIWLAAEWISEEHPYEKQLVTSMEEFIAVMRELIGI